MLPNTFLCLVIPVYKEELIIHTLNSLYACHPPQQAVEIILVVNHSENDGQKIKELSKKTIEIVNSFLDKNDSDWLKCYVIKAFDLPKKKAGVGLARKIGMDEAAYRFNQINVDGIIVCFDADSLCEVNYFQEIERAFQCKKEHMAASIHYEHPLYLDEGILNWPIIHYELHLRYYIQALAYSGYPFAFHTIGSSMAVRSSMYQKSGGMNTRKAGEDFYFLHKIIPLGGFINITNTKIIPSSRESDRVPFGTGKAIRDNNSSVKLLGYTYSFGIFNELKAFFNGVETHFEKEKISNRILTFLRDNQLIEELEILEKLAKNKEHFVDRFYQWFNGFKVLKCVHYLRDNYYPDVPVEMAVNELLSQDNRFKLKKPSIEDGLVQLINLREFEKGLNYTI